MEKCRNASKNTNESRYFSQKNRKKTLDKGGTVWYISQARSRGTERTSKANLENDTEERTRNKEEKDSEDSERV